MIIELNLNLQLEKLVIKVDHAFLIIINLTI